MNRMSSRVAASLMTAIGGAMPLLAVDSVRQFEDIAVRYTLSPSLCDIITAIDQA